MVDRRGSRFVLEALFLVALAAALAFARLSAIEIAGLMLLGWVVVGALEWAAWRSRPHFASGLPPRYFVPAAELPPALPLEQVEQVELGYPDASRDEAPTWIASADLRAEVLGEWPIVAVPPPRAHDDQQEEDDRQEEEDDLRAEPVRLPPRLPEPEPVPEPEPEPQPEPEPEAAAPSLPPLPAPVSVGTARHHLDPLGDVSAPRKRFGRARRIEAGDVIEVPARPSGVRPLPRAMSRR